MALQQAVTAQGFGLSSMSQWKGEWQALRWMDGWECIVGEQHLFSCPWNNGCCTHVQGVM